MLIDLALHGILLWAIKHIYNIWSQKTSLYLQIYRLFLSFIMFNKYVPDSRTKKMKITGVLPYIHLQQRLIIFAL